MQVVGARVVEKLVDDGVDLVDVGRHVFARLLVGHAHFGFQPQPRQRRAQVVRDAGEHERAVLLDLREALRHAVEADVDLADLAGGHGLVELAGFKIAIAHAACGERQFLERAVDQACDHRSPGQREQGGGAQPDQPGGAGHRPDARGIGEQPVGIAIDRKTDPQTGFAVDFPRYHRVGAEPGAQPRADIAAQRIEVVAQELVAGFARGDAKAFFVGQRLDQRDARDRVRMHQRRAAEVDQRGELLRALQRAWLVLQRAKGLKPGHDAAHQQHGKKEKSAPEQTEAAARPHGQRRRRGFEVARLRVEGNTRLQIGHQALPSGTNT